MIYFVPQDCVYCGRSVASHPPDDLEWVGRDVFHSRCYREYMEELDQWEAECLERQFETLEALEDEGF